MRERLLSVPERDHFTNNDLSPIERLFVGATTSLEGKIFNEEVLKRHLDQGGKITSSMLIPVSILSREQESSHVQKLRKSQFYLNGVFPLFGEYSLLLTNKGLTPALILPPFSKSGNSVIPQWELKLLQRGWAVDPGDFLRRFDYNKVIPEYLKISILERTGQTIVQLRKKTIKPHENIRYSS